MLPVSLSGPKTPASKLSTQDQESDQNIAVFVRCRPLKAGEKKNVVDMLPEQKMVRVNERGAALGEKYSRLFNFDSVFSGDTPQLEVYKAVVAPLIDQVIAGYNCTVFAYGQTGTGKTYTMEGERSSEETSWETDPLSGIIPRALHQLFETLKQCLEYTVRVSFMELYNEELYDLLSALDDTTKLKVFDDPVRKGSVVISGLEEITVQSKAEIYEILKKGSAKRQTASTLLNACSSRSHTIFSVTVHIKENNIDGEDLLKIGKLNLVDLAGSENIGRSGAIEKRAREAGNINQSLLTLGRVITSLVEKAPHVPYRESKLTRLLKDSLGGRTKTSIIATISPSALDAEDTLSTLDYAQRAKKITNKPEINQKLSKKTLLREYTAEIERLRRDLIACREKSGFYVNEANYLELVQKSESQAKSLEDKENEIKALKEELERLMESFTETSEELSCKSVALAKTTECLEETAKTLREKEQNLEEQKHLVDIHSTNEQKLLSQAEEILAVADAATGDLVKLHRKLDCHKSLEVDNFAKLSEFQNSFVSKMRHFQTLLECGADTVQDHILALKPKIDENFDGICTKIYAIAENIQIHESENEKIVDMMVNENNNGKSLVEDLTAIGDVVSNQRKAAAESGDNVKATISRQAEHFQSFVESVVDGINMQRQEIENILLAENDRIQKVIGFRTAAFRDLKGHIEEYMAHETAKTNVLLQTISKLEEKLQKSSQANEDRIAQIQEQLNQQLNDLRSDAGQRCSEMKTDFDEMRSQIASNDDLSLKSKKQILQKVELISDDLEVDEKLQSDSVNKLDDLNSRNVQLNVNNLNQLKNEIKATAAQTEKLIHKAFNQREEGHEKLAALNSNISSALSEHVVSNEELIVKLRSLLAEDVIRFKESTAEAAESTRSVKESTLEGITCIESQANTWYRSCNREISARCSEFDLLNSGKLNRYVPTGNTPHKREFDYPHDLVKTTPHDVIVNRYRLAKNEMIAVATPLPDDSDIETQSTESFAISYRSSSQSDFSNVENYSPSAIPTPIRSTSTKSKHGLKMRGNKMSSNKDRVMKEVGNKKPL